MPTILILEDEKDFQRLLTLVLERAGYDILVSDNGSEGLEMIYTHHPALVIADHLLPGLTGGEVCLTIKNDPSVCHIPVIIHSNSPHFRSKLQAENVRADAILPKPCPPREIVAMVNSLLSAVV